MIHAASALIIINNYETITLAAVELELHSATTVTRGMTSHNRTLSRGATRRKLRILAAGKNKKAQLSLTNPRDAKACQKLLQFDVLTTLSLTILAYLHAFSCCCVPNLRNPEKFTENSNL